MADETGSSRELHETQRKPRRLFVEGELWLVYELPAMQFDRRQTPSLVFESEITVRRVRDFPVHWRDLSDADLFALSWSA